MLRLAAVLAFLPLLPGPAPQTMETREYDLRIPALDIAPPPLGLTVESNPPQSAETGFAPENIEEALRALFGDKVWEEDQAGLSYEDGILTVTHRPAVHDVVAAAVRHLRHGSARPVRIDTQLVEMDPAAYASWRGTDAGPVLSEAQAKALSVALAEGRAQIVKEFASRIPEGREALLKDVETRSYLRDLDCQIAESAVMEDPVHTVMQIGDAWTVAASGLPGRDLIRIDFAMRRFDLVSEEEFAPIDQGTPITLPRARRQEHHQTFVAPDGRPVMPAAWQLEGKTRFLTLRARLMPAGDSGPVTGPSGIVLSVLPFQSVFRPVLSRRAPEIPEFLGRQVIGVTESSEDEQEDLRADRILERVREGTAGWELPGSAFQADERAVILRHDKDRTAAAERQLAKAVEPLFKMVTVETRVLALDGMGLARLKSAEPPPAEVVRDPGLAAAASELTLLEGQLGHVADLGVRTFVSDMDCQIATKSTGFDPLVEEAVDGLEVEVRARGAEGGRISLNVKAWLAQAELTVKAPAKVRTHRVLLQAFHVPVSMAVKEGEWTIAGLTSRKKGAETVHLALIVRATRSK